MTNEMTAAKQNQQPATPKKSRSMKVALALVLLVLLGGSAYGLAPKSWFKSAPAGPVPVATDGEWTVGTGAGQLTPGTYRTPSPAKGVSPLSCRWTLTLPAGGQMDQWTQHGAGMPDRVVTLAEGETFVTEDCGYWVLEP